MRQVGEERDPAYYDYEYPDPYKKPRRRRPKFGRMFLSLLIVILGAWLLYSLLGSLIGGQKFSVFGPADMSVRNVVVAGVDEGGYRTDLILLCRVDREKNQLNILQIPRDTKINNKRNDKKINSAYYSGFDCLRAEINQVTGISPDNYIIVSFDAFNEIIDALGGVTVDVPIRMYYTDPVQNLTIDLQPGKQKLDGEQAQMFMRFRKNNDGTGYANGDTDRINTQKLLYTAVLDKLKSPAGIIHLPAVLLAVKKHTSTDLNGDLTSVLFDMAACSGDMNFYSLPGSGKYIGGVSYFVHNTNETQALISAHFR